MHNIMDFSSGLDRPEVGIIGQCVALIVQNKTNMDKNVGFNAAGAFSVQAACVQPEF